jgi:hypothetical protein
VANDARDEFEVLPFAYRRGTSKLYSRRDFLPPDDRRAFSEADFIGRLRALFGPVEGDEYVLRHRATGFVVTAYAAQSGPAYGGGPAEPGVAPVVARLDELVSAVEPADWEKLQYWFDPPSVHRIGIRGGVVIDESVPAAEGVEWLLAQAEQQQRTRPVDDRALRYWVHKAGKGKRVDGAVARVQAMWFRVVAEINVYPERLHDQLLARARGDAAALEIDPEKAEAALRAASVPPVPPPTAT